MRRILVIEDSPEDLDVLKTHLTCFFQRRGEKFDLSCRGGAFDLEDEACRFDLVFLDIDLPGISGMEAAHTLRNRGFQTPVVFVTSLARLAAQSYEVDALDYLVKPIAYADFETRMDRALRKIDGCRGRSLVLEVQDGLRVVFLPDVVAVEVKNHECTFRLVRGGTLSARISLADVERRTAGGPFLRVSKSCLVNATRVKAVRGRDVIMSDESRFALSRSYRTTFMQELAARLGGLE